MQNIIGFFVSRQFLSHLIVAIITAGGLFSAYDIRKEELPDFSFDRVVIRTFLAGAAPQDIEQSITQPLEIELQGLEYIHRMTSSSKRGQSVIVLQLRKGIENTDLAVGEIRNRVQSVDLPAEVEKPPSIHHFKTSQKAIIDIGLYYSNKSFLNKDERRKLQKVVRQLESRLLAHPELTRIDRKSYFPEEVHISPRPADLFRNRIGMGELQRALKAGHTIRPLGVLETARREQIRLSGRLEKLEDFPDLPVRSSVLGPVVRLRDVADVKQAFQDQTSLLRINGHEGVVINVVKSSSTGILEGIEVVERELKVFMEGRRESDPHLRAVLLDDESYDVRNRLSLVLSNALLGLALIITILSFFLNPKTALWVSVGIPFSILFTLIFANLFGQTINNMSLAGVIIAMGMLVDDAIVVSENVARHRAHGMGAIEASIKGTREVVGPITASILTTIAAFLPLMAVEGRVAIMTVTIPPIVALILTGSLLESVFVLPGHLAHTKMGGENSIIQMVRNILRRGREGEASSLMVEGRGKGGWFERFEGGYIRRLSAMLKYRYWVLGGFALFILASFLLGVFVLRFSLFPRESMKNFFVIMEAPEGTTLLETAKRAKPLEDLLLPYVGKEVVGIRTAVGYRRYRTSGEENIVSLRVELDERHIDGDGIKRLLKKVRKHLKGIKGYKKARVATHRFGSDSGSAVEILVQENDDAERNRMAEELAAELRKIKGLGYVEIERPSALFEYLIDVNRSLLSRLDVDMEVIQTNLRAGLSGIRLFSFYRDNEEVHVRLRLGPESRKDIRSLMKLPTSNRQGYQIPMGSLMKPRRKATVAEIKRVNQRTVLRVLADIKPESERTPLEVAKELEAKVFPGLIQNHPGSILVFDGEVRDTREASSFFIWSVLGVLLLIYFILTIQFNSPWRPLMVMTAILPAWAVLVYVYLLHGVTVFGLFTVTGALGLSGIVVNGSILLLDRLESGDKICESLEELRHETARLASLRLRAVFLTTVTTVAGLLPSAYGVLGYDPMLAEMMLTLAWGLLFSMMITLVLIPTLHYSQAEIKLKRRLAGQGHP